MAMSKDKEGRPIFIKGKEYRPKVWVNPVWMIGQASKCVETEPFTYGKEDGTEETIKDGRGTFTNGNDTRSYVATTQFEEV
jgi:hypothetical protein